MNCELNPNQDSQFSILGGGSQFTIQCLHMIRSVQPHYLREKHGVDTSTIKD